MLAQPDIFTSRFFSGSYSPSSSYFHPEALGHYTAQLSSADCVAGMCEDYRAASTIDLEHARKDREEDRMIKCDLRVVWGKKGVIELCYNALAEWRKVCEGVVSGEAVEAGHYIAEETPEVVERHVLEFFKADGK
jgi:haloacetate dehalogenase